MEAVSLHARCTLSAFSIGILFWHAFRGFLFCRGSHVAVIEARTSRVPTAVHSLVHGFERPRYSTEKVLVASSRRTGFFPCMMTGYGSTAQRAFLEKK